jgi:hypothetical protein
MLSQLGPKEERAALFARIPMELFALWHLIRRRWWLIALPFVVTLVLTLPALKNVVAPPVTYSVQIRLTAAAPPDAQIEGVTTPYEDTVYVPLLASEYVVVNMPPWITSDSLPAKSADCWPNRGSTSTATTCARRLRRTAFAAS